KVPGKYVSLPLFIRIGRISESCDSVDHPIVVVLFTVVIRANALIGRVPQEGVTKLVCDGEIAAPRVPPDGFRVVGDKPLLDVTPSELLRPGRAGSEAVNPVHFPSLKLRGPDQLLRITHRIKVFPPRAPQIPPQPFKHAASFFRRTPKPLFHEPPPKFLFRVKA